ncbi:hypothetical protein QC762_0027750 [Podospora pseudocomata]|uniref:Uncharacterized protein n=1 Tax=Podospora pseudocomata TaxID=2093779 RepID=A0ABR0GRL3_9PEZI|nr:hypothetical protein QC762_0027750 [Podospora pseudocomata]
MPPDRPICPPSDGQSRLHDENHIHVGELLLEEENPGAIGNAIEVQNTDQGPFRLDHPYCPDDTLPLPLVRKQPDLARSRSSSKREVPAAFVG